MTNINVEENLKAKNEEIQELTNIVAELQAQLAYEFMVNERLTTKLQQDNYSDTSYY